MRLKMGRLCLYLWNRSGGWGPYVHTHFPSAMPETPLMLPVELQKELGVLSPKLDHLEAKTLYRSLKFGRLEVRLYCR